MHQGARGPAGQSSASLGVEDQVLANIRNQSIGQATVADLGMPETFLRRVAGRVLQLSYQEHFRIVVADGPGQLEHEIWKPSSPPCDVEVLHYEGSGLEAPEGSSMPSGRGFFPRLLDDDVPLPRVASGDPELVSLIAQRLAKDGLLLTAAKAIVLLQAGGPTDSARVVEALGNAGYPLDLLAHFAPEGVRLSSADEVIGWLITKVVSTSPAIWSRMLSKAAFRFQPTLPGFRASPDSGQAAPAIVRLQLSRGGYWIGPGDGGSIDLLRQIAEANPGAQVLASVETRHLEEIKACLADWPEDLRGRLRLISQDLTLSQWAQDSSKNGANAEGRPVTLVPRFATRGEEISLFVPGDTYLAGGLVAAGLDVRHSPLLFQGGNLIVVEEPSRRRVLLAGEAEVHRNQSLGLTREQAIAALNGELGTDKCVVLPAASIHIDYEVSCRVQDGKAFAFVIDSLAGAKVVVEQALGILERLGRLSGEQAAMVREHLLAGRMFDGAALVWLGLRHAAVGPGRFPLGFAKEFRDEPSDSGVGNLHRLLAALDILMSTSARGVDGIADKNMQIQLRILGRRLEDRTQLKSALRNLGWTVIAVPGMAHSERSVNPLNGLHTPDAYLMPIYGGLFSRLDEAAQAVIARALGPSVRIVPVRSGESQRRDGALRCSVSLLCPGAFGYANASVD